MSCNPKCKPANYMIWDGSTPMIAQPGNPHFKPGEKHKKCLSCLQEDTQRAATEMAVAEMLWLKKTNRLEKLSEDQLADLQRRLGNE